MAEAEDVIIDAARHATVFVQELWRRHHPVSREAIDVPSLLHRIDLLLASSFPTRFQLRIAQPPAPIPLVRRMFLRAELPVSREAIPTTDGRSIWLPLSSASNVGVLQAIAFQQATRATRGAASHLTNTTDTLTRSIFEVLEADAADAVLVASFPGMRVRIESIRKDSLHTRPPLESFPPVRRALETWVRSVLTEPLEPDASGAPSSALLELARALAHEFERASASTIAHRGHLFRDRWTGELREPTPASVHSRAEQALENAKNSPVRSARMKRRPDVRAPDERDEKTQQGAWMVQTAQPHEHAEDPFGMQRPTDRDEHQAADDFAESLSDLSEARLVTVPGAPKEILLSDDSPPTSARNLAGSRSSGPAAVLRYPEWDFHSRTYREPGAAVHLLDANVGPRAWVERTLEEHRALLQAVKHQFESLRAERVRLRQQLDGDELDLQACVDAFADARSGTSIERGLYQCTRTARRELAVSLLIDVSGSTDGWVSQHRRVIDVEREALLLVCLALQSLGEPYSVLAFSGESAQGVTVRSVKSFAESFGPRVAERIAGLEPEKYTRAGAAIRHATSLLMRERARHRLLLLLSDGRPNDMDEYDGRYGIEDMRQSIIEARLQGIFPFCLTIDRHTASYLPAVFGEHQYAVLHRPELLTTALLGWLRRLVQR
jgi:nitric oxide reductase NorD protein